MTFTQRTFALCISDQCLRIYTYFTKITFFTINEKKGDLQIISTQMVEEEDPELTSSRRHIKTTSKLQPHPLAERLPKIIIRPQTPQNTPPALSLSPSLSLPPPHPSLSLSLCLGSGVEDGVCMECIGFREILGSSVSPLWEEGRERKGKETKS